MPQPRRTHNLEHVAALVFGQPWAILPSRMNVVAGVVSLYLDGEKPTELEAREAAQAMSYGAEEAPPSAPTVAVLPMHGTIMQHAGMFERLSGGVDPQAWAEKLRALADNPDVREIILDVDSGGGSVDGTQDMYQAVKYAAGQKIVTAVANGAMCSAAYWASSPASAIVVTPTATVGSISVLMMHQDQTGKNEQAGLKTTVLRTGAQKALGGPHEPLSDLAHASVMERLTSVHDVFVADVAAARHLSAEQVQQRWADGRVWIGEHAVAAGLADETGFLRDVVGAAQDRHASSPATRTSRAAKQPHSPARAETPGGHPMDPDTLALLGLAADATPEHIQAALDKRQKTAASTERAGILAALGLTSETGSDAHLRSMAAEAADGRLYRESQLDRLHALTITVEGNGEAGQAAADEAREVYAGQSLVRIGAQIARLEARRDTLPAGRQSKAPGGQDGRGKNLRLNRANYGR